MFNHVTVGASLLAKGPDREQARSYKPKGPDLK
jgi:hypothetical protein